MENLRELWQQYDGELKASRAVNETILRRLLEERSADKVSRILNLEYLNMVVYALVLVVLLCTPQLMGNQPEVRIAWGASLLFMAAGLGWTIFKVRLLHHTDTGSLAVTDAIRRVESFRLLMQREKVVGLFIMPFVLAVLITVAHQLRYGNSILNYVRMYAWRLAVSYPVVILLSIWLYRRYYFRNIRSILRNLKELKGFREE